MLLEVTTAVAGAATDNNRLMEILSQSDIVIKLTLFILLFFSVVSWAIIFFKFTQLKTARRAVARFTSQFWKSESIETFAGRAKGGAGPAANIFRCGTAPLRDGDAKTRKLRVTHETKRATEQEIENLEYYTPFLATTASASPFIGLFGTCWGILNAFFELSAAGSSSLQVVGPRIAEALFATAVGLAVAIPALVFYNFFVNKIRLLSREMEQFSDDLTHRIENEYFAA